ncbi:glycosyltransferase family 2 protein, partial [Aureobasidium melanogenum]
MINTVCIVLSFGLFSVWYATAPLILLAPLVRSTMVVDLIVSHAYKKVRLLLGPPEEELEVPTMDYATAVSFSNESFEDIQSTLDSLVDQKDVDMHKNLLLISCNDNVWNSESAKSTTRIILENILTNIVDEAKFQMPRDGPDAGFDNMWCRRGIYKGLPYILMIKEGMTNRVEFVDLIRNLLHSYNLRKESYHNSVPSAFFAWYEEWAELQDFASFDFLVNVNSETLLDEHCISQLYQQA